jgi:hypothetical protein
MEKESTGERGMGVGYKGSQGQTKRTVELQEEEEVPASRPDALPQETRFPSVQICLVISTSSSERRTLDQCFPTFVRPRPGKLFFYKTRARGPTNFLVNIFQIFLSSSIKLA